MFSVPAEHLKISPEMMGEGDRLRLLQVGETRHEGIQILLHDAQDSLQKMLQQGVRLVNLIADVKLHIQRDLIIAAAAGMQLLSGVPDPADQMRLHKAVNILIFIRKCKFPALDIPENGAESADNLLHLPV